jgi:hypothetical protein
MKFTTKTIEYTVERRRRVIFASFGDEIIVCRHCGRAVDDTQPSHGDQSSEGDSRTSDIKLEKVICNEKS